MELFGSHQEGTTNKELEMELNKAEFNREKNTEPLLLTENGDQGREGASHSRTGGRESETRVSGQ